MTAIWHWLLGLSRLPADARDGEWSLGFHALPEGIWLPLSIAGVLLAAAGIWFLYQRDARGLSLPRRLTLALLRVAVLGLVVLMLAEVVLVIRTTQSIPSHLPVLIDTSQSMALNDPYTDPTKAASAAAHYHLQDQAQPDVAALRQATRIELAERALAPHWEDLAQGRILKRYAFDASLEPLESSEHWSARGNTSAIGEAIGAALARHRGQPLAGMLLITDGRATAGDDLLAAARRAAAAGVPIYTLAAGTEEGPRNVRLAELETSPAVFVHDTAEITALVESRGLNGQSAVVSLEHRQPEGEWQETATQTVSLGEDGALVPVRFRWTPEAIGNLELRAVVSEAGPEISETDNVATTSLRVVRQRIRVLVIAGYPSPEFQFLRNSLLRDQHLEFSSWLQTAAPEYENVGLRPLRRLPTDQAELDRWDVVVLFDPDPSRLPPDWSELLTKFVGDAGGGLVYISGELYTRQLFNPGQGVLAGASTDNGWVRTLPVVLDPGLFQTEAEVALSSRETWTLELSAEGYEDSVFQFDPDPARNRDVIASLPGMYWHFPVTRAKPAATVLAHHGDPRMQNRFGRHVLLATQLYGPGRTVFVGFDSTYRWRFLHEGYFDGFWARLIDRVGRSKALGGRHPLRLVLDKMAYRPGDRVRLRAELVGSGESTAGFVAGQSELAAEIEGASQPPQSIALTAVPNDPGVFEAIFPVSQAGTYTARVALGGAAETEGGPRPASVSFRVEPPHDELDRPTVDRGLLDEVARITGGQTWSLDQVDAMPASIVVREIPQVIENREEIWDSPLLLGGIVLLLTIEWITRKWNQLA